MFYSICFSSNLLLVSVPSHVEFEPLSFYKFSLTSHTSQFFRQSLRQCKVIRNPANNWPRESGIPGSTTKECGLQNLEFGIQSVESRMLCLAWHDGRFTVWGDKINSEMFALSCNRVSLLLGTLRSNDATTTRTSLKNWTCVLSFLTGIIPAHLLCQS